MPPIVLTVLGIVQLAVKAAPEVAKVYAELRKLIAMWFGGGIITIEQQRVLNNWSNNHEAETLAGNVPPELQVEPDPIIPSLAVEADPVAAVTVTSPKGTSVTPVPEGSSVGIEITPPTKI